MEFTTSTPPATPATPAPEFAPEFAPAFASEFAPATIPSISGEMNIQPETVISSVPTLRRERASDYGMFEPDFEFDVYNWFHYANNERRMLMIDQLNDMILHDRIMSQSPVVEDAPPIIRPMFSKPILSRTMSVRPATVEDDEEEDIRQVAPPTLSRPTLSRTMSVRPGMVENNEEIEYFTPPTIFRTTSVRPVVEQEQQYFTPPALFRNMSSVAPIFDYDSDDMPGLIPCDD